MRANEHRDSEINEQPGAQAATTDAGDASQREPYVPPVIEKFPPMGNVTFGTNVQPMLAMSLAGA